MSFKNELYEVDVLKRIGELRATGTPFTVIALKLKEEKGIDVTPTTVSSAYDKFVGKTSEIIASDDNIKRELLKPILDTANQLKKINEFTWDIIDDFETENSDKLKAIKEIRGQLELQEKILNRMSESLNPTNISKLEYTKMSIKNLIELEKQGLITINRRMDEPIILKEADYKETTESDTTDNGVDEK